MKVIFAIFVAIVGIFANVSADGKEDGNLLKVLAAERKETNEMFKRENQRLRQEDDQLHGKLDKLQGQNKKLEKKNKKLAKEIIKLRGADSEIQASIRQKDQLQNGTRSALDLDDHVKKVCKSEIIDFLTKEKVCVSGTIYPTHPNDKWNDHTIEFGYSFPQKPTVSTSIAIAFLSIEGKFDARAKVKSVSKSSVVISTYQNYPTEFRDVSWIACL